MGIKSALFQNFYMDFNEVIEAGERIRSVMSAVDGCMEEADGLFCRISALAGNVPAKARCGVLLSACEQARAGIKKADFLAYGNRVSRNMFELADYILIKVGISVLNFSPMMWRKDKYLSWENSMMDMR